MPWPLLPEVGEIALKLEPGVYVANARIDGCLSTICSVMFLGMRSVFLPLPPTGCWSTGT
ncbi:hypothetical protein [Methanopyrus sp.]